ncbi:MAG: HD domain-containing protein [Acidobacteriota bacterium]|jgi:(p)ppGpp synthase/HD superfamily hydrolase
MATLERAVEIAAQAHQGQRDKAGAPYLLHPLRLMLRMTSETTMIAAVLHDVVEDSAWTLADLRAAGFAEEILCAVDCLTRRAEESYEQFITRVKTNALARQVKLADLEDNLNLQRITNLTPNDLARIERYHRARRELLEGEL